MNANDDWRCSLSEVIHGGLHTSASIVGNKLTSDATLSFYYLENSQNYFVSYFYRCKQSMDWEALQKKKLLHFLQNVGLWSQVARFMATFGWNLWNWILCDSFESEISPHWLCIFLCGERSRVTLGLGSFAAQDVPKIFGFENITSED